MNDSEEMAFLRQRRKEVTRQLQQLRGLDDWRDLMRVLADIELRLGVLAEREYRARLPLRIVMRDD